MPEYLTPGVYFEFQDAAPSVIRQVRMDITGFVGLAERGPLNQPTQIDSWRQFQVLFGNFVPYGYLAYAVKGFFENGGRTCFIVRVAGVTAAQATHTLKNSAGIEVMQFTAVNEGSWGNQIAIALTQVRPSKLDFSLTIFRNSLDRESFFQLSIKPDDPRYFVHLLNEGDDRTAPSQWIRVEDKITGSRDDSQLPDIEKSKSNAEKSKIKQPLVFLNGGQDGISSLTTDDFLGTADVLASDRKGLSAFDRVHAIGIVCIPDIHIQPVLLLSPAPPEVEPPRDPCVPITAPIQSATPIPATTFEQPPLFTLNQVAQVQQALVEHCERHQDRVAILDTAVRPGSGTTFTLAEVEQWRQTFDSQRGFGALYYPWIKVIDPLNIGGNPVRPIPACGHIAGLYARSDFTVGVHKAPANAELLWSEDVTAVVDDASQGVLNPEGIDCLRAFPGRGIRVYGARTISSDPDWRYVNVRRLMLMIEKAVDESTQWTVFEPNNLNLRRSLILSVSGFLENLWRRGALVGGAAEEAFYVKCDETNNPPEVVNQGQIIVDVGVAPTHPAEFIVFRVGRTVEELEIVER